MPAVRVAGWRPHGSLATRGPTMHAWRVESPGGTSPPLRKPAPTDDLQGWHVPCPICARFGTREGGSMINTKRKPVPRMHLPLRRLALCLHCDECFEITDACPA